MVLRDVDEVPVAQAFQRRHQILVLDRVEPADRPEPRADVVEAQRRFQPLVGLAEGVQDRNIQPGPVSAGEAEHLGRDTDRAHAASPHTGSCGRSPR